MKYEILNRIRENVLVAVLRGKDDEDIMKIADKVLEGGIKTIELTFSTPYVKNAIEILSKKYSSNKNIIIGAGTVLDEITAGIAITSGAKFIVSPHFNKKISKICNIYKIPYMPGCMSVTEIVSALQSGVDVVKLFPGGFLKSDYIKDLKGPLKNISVMPSGGVDLENMREWINAGAFAIGIGSSLTKNINKLGYDSVRVETLRFIDKLNENKDMKGNKYE